MSASTQKVVVCGAGFLGSYIAKALLAGQVPRHVQLTSRSPSALLSRLQSESSSHADRISATSADVTDPSTLTPAFAGASAVVSLVGIMHGSRETFDAIQWHGAENVAREAKAAGAKLVHVSAIGADAESGVDYCRTKALGEQAVWAHCPDATVVRPSLVFGPGDGFFARFAELSKYLPFMPVFGGGTTRFQPVFAEDVARIVEIACRTSDLKAREATDGKVIEAGGPDIITYREIMQKVLKYSNRTRPIISAPFFVGTMQGFVLEKLPPNLFTLTRAQVEQLKSDNVVSKRLEDGDFSGLLQQFYNEGPKSVDQILPTYL